MACVRKYIKDVSIAAIASVVTVAQSAHSSPIPDISRYDSVTRQSLELACISDKVRGPSAYGDCLNSQIEQIGKSPGIPNLSQFESEARQSLELACISDKVNGPAAYAKCLNNQIAAYQHSSPIRNLGEFDRETRQSIELACISDKTNGPAAYSTCINRQVASMKNDPGIPSLLGLDRVTRQSIELACIGEKAAGPAAYGKCLRRQVASIVGSGTRDDGAGEAGIHSEAPAIVAIPSRSTPPKQEATATDSRVSEDIAGNETVTGEATVKSTTSNQAPRVKPNSSQTSHSSPVSSHGVAQSARTPDKFSTENIMKVRQGLSSNRILELFGPPKNISQSMCGASVGKPWSCTTWEYGGFPGPRASFTFADVGGNLVLNNFDINRD